MTDVPPGTGTPPPPAGAHTNLRSLAILCYVLYLLALVNGLTAVAGVILAYVKRSDARGTIWHSHFENLIVVFWVMVVAGLAGVIGFAVSLGEWTYLGILGQWTWPFVSVTTLPFVLGLLIFPIFTIWYLYRVIAGLIRAGDDRPWR